MEEITQENRFNIALETKLWRYMSFAKFSSLLRNKKLVLPSAQMFEDPYEGACDEAKYADALVNYMSDRVDKLIKEQGKYQVDPDTIRLVTNEVCKSYSEVGASNKYFAFISCWHENETESEAMWKLYTQKQPEGIAIQTTYAALKSAIDEPKALIGRVSYVDYRHTFFTSDSYFWYKRKFFEHEREVRVMVLPDEDERKKLAEDYKRGTIVASLSVDLEKLIQKVYVSPYADDWFKDLVVDELKRYDLTKPVFYSGLNQHPIYFPTAEQINQAIAKNTKDIE